MKKLDVAICFVLLTISELIFKLSLGMEIKLLAVVLSFISFGFFVSVAWLLKKKWRLVLESIYIILFNIYLFTQNYYYLFFKNLWSVLNLKQIKELTGVIGEISSKFSPWLLAYPIIVILWFVLIRSIKIKEFKTKNISIVWPILFLVLNIFVVTKNISYYDDFYGQLTVQSQKDYLYQEMLDKPLFAEEFGVPEYIKRDLVKANNTKSRKPTQQEIEEISKWMKEQKINERTGEFEGRNLIFVQAESLTNQAIDPVLTPTLYKMKTEGIYFSNFYAPLYPANTNDTEFILQTGLMPSIEGETTSYGCENNAFPYSLASLLKEKGYSVNSYHSFFGEFYNREVFHKTLGFENYYSLQELLPKHVGMSNGLYWTDDIELMKAYMENQKAEPYYSFIISASGHLPYEEERKQLQEEFETIKKYWGDKYNDEIAYYQATQMKLDKGLEYLIQENPDAVIVMVGDHYPYSLTDESQDLFLETGLDRYKVPFIIYANDIEAKMIEQVRGSFDVQPTIANLFALKTPIMFGVDALSDDETTVYFKNGDIVNSFYQGKSENFDAWTIGQLILNTDYWNR